MTQMVTFADKKIAIKEFLDQAPDSQYTDVHPTLCNLPKKQQEIHVNRLKQIALVQMDKNPKIAECAPITIYTSLRDAAKLGLLPNSTTQEGHLVPFYSGKNKRMECQFMAGYKGLITLAMRTGHVSGVDVRAVHLNDEFSFGYGLHPFCNHIPARTNRGDFIGAYAVIDLKEGVKKFEYVSEEEGLEHGEKFTNSKNKAGEVFGNWADNPIPMIMKTSLRKALKYCPLSNELDMAIHIDEAQNDPNYEHEEPKALPEGGGRSDIAEPEALPEDQSGDNENGREPTNKGGKANAGEETQGAGTPEEDGKATQGGTPETGKENETKQSAKEEKVQEQNYLPEGVCQDMMDHAMENGIKKVEYIKLLNGMKIKGFNKVPHGESTKVMEVVKKEIAKLEAAKK